MNKELLYNQLYDKTKDCGRTQFVKLLMEKERENQQLKEHLKQKEDIINKAKEYCNFCIKEWITDDGFVEEVLKDVLEILDNKGE